MSTSDVSTYYIILWFSNSISARWGCQVPFILRSLKSSSIPLGSDDSGRIVSIYQWVVEEHLVLTLFHQWQVSKSSVPFLSVLYLNYQGNCFHELHQKIQHRRYGQAGSRRRKRTEPLRSLPRDRAICFALLQATNPPLRSPSRT